MSDVENVIKGLKEFIADLKPYAGNSADWKKVDDALELLKKQEEKENECKRCATKTSAVIEHLQERLKEREPIKPNEYDPVIYGTRYTCGACKHKIYRNENYCHNCGRPVKWDD